MTFRADRGSVPVWRSYATVYALMNDLPFVRELRSRHLEAVNGARRVVDAGCGVGLISAALAASTERQVLALDYDDGMLEQARDRLAGCATTRLVGADVQQLPIADQWADGHVSNNVLFCLGRPQAALREAARVTAPGGRLSMASPRRGIDVEVLIRAMRAHFDAWGAPAPAEAVERFIESNRAVRSSFRNLYEPHEVPALLEPYWTVVSVDVVYLEQGFHVVARRNDRRV